MQTCMDTQRKRGTLTQNTVVVVKYVSGLSITEVNAWGSHELKRRRVYFSSDLEASVHEHLASSYRA